VKTVYRILIAVVVPVLAAVLQMAAATALAIGPARPDILLTTIVCCAMQLDLPAAAAVGVWGGLLMATVVGVNFGSFLVSRSIAGVVGGWLGAQPIASATIAAVFATFAATFLCEGAYYLMAPAHRGLWWIERVALEAVYNMLLSVPISLALSKAGLRLKSADGY